MSVYGREIKHVVRTQIVVRTPAIKLSRAKKSDDKPVQPPVRENTEDRSIARLDEGLDEFFTKTVIHEYLLPTSLETSPTAVASPSSGSRTLKKKIGHFFAFKKPKSSRGAKSEKDSEGSPSPARGRKLMLSDILRTPSKASDSAKALSKSEEGGLAGENRGYLDQSQTPDSARRARPKYSREGKSQSLILLSGEETEGLGERHEKSKDGEIKKAGSDDPSVRTGYVDPVGRAGTEPSGGSFEGRLSWKVLGKQLNAEFKGKCSELSPLPRRGFASQEPAGPREQKGRESWSSSLPRTGRSTAAPLPLRRTSNADAKFPLCLQRSPILKWKTKPKLLLETGPSAPSDSLGPPPQEQNVVASDSRVETEDLPQAIEQTLKNAQNTALDQRTAVPLSKSPIHEH
ncbi:hypothetical protein E2320_001160 [Naja naja]|nr:hypothetical protein E2320_001160 [Naja naja]